MPRPKGSSEVERLLAKGSAFSIDQINCMQHAKVLKRFARHVEETPWQSKAKHKQLVFKVAFISICHQFNWDFMQAAVFRLLLQRDVDMLEVLSSVTSKDINSLLAGYPDQTRVRSKERARLLRNVGLVLKERYPGPTGLESFHHDCQVAQLGTHAFQKLLDAFEAYRLDPLKKKTNVLSHDLHCERIVDFIDPENMEPAIDYHIMRVYLRTGRVIPAEAVKPFLQGSPNPRHAIVKALRTAVSEAAKLTAKYASMNVADLNFFEWQIGRAVCTNENPKCDSTIFEKPLASDVQELCERGCAYRLACQARTDSSFLALEEPDLISTAY